MNNQNHAQPAPRREEVISSDGARCEIAIYESATPDAQAVVVCMPAMGVSADYYVPLAQALAACGHHVVLADLRGYGTSSVRAGRGTNFGYYEMVHFDYPALFSRVKTAFAKRRIVLLGHSLGGQLGALYTAVADDPPDALMLIACCNVHYKGWASPWKILGGVATLRAIVNVLGYLPGKQVGFGGREAKNVILDWSNNCFRGTYRVLNSSVDYHEKMAKLALPVLVLSFERDGFAPKKAVENLYRLLGESTVEHHHIATTEPGFEKTNHFNWARRPEGVMRYIEPWMARLPDR